MLAGCGGDEGIPAVGAGTEPGEGGTLVWALEDRVREVDPLLATSAAERLVVRQVHEPLVGRLAGPFEAPRRVDGLALSARPAGSPAVWRLELRPGVQFQDGTRLNAAAVLANVERWRSTAIGNRLLAGLAAADAPRPHTVRFILLAPDRRFGARLASPRLGLVSPRALGADPAVLGGRPLRAEDAGTGPFEVRERDRDRVLLARNTSWWGSEHELGPALEQVELISVAAGRERVRMLLEGDVQVADAIGARGARRLRVDPLLLALAQGDRGWRGAERSVRGIQSGRGMPQLQRVWLTTLRP